MRRAPSPARLLRCVVYTRKSSEEGLEQDFNSLQAQREACEAYITSQQHEGWRCLPNVYDDGGYSGGSMDRPGLTQLLADVAAKRIDVVVVYKVDRLTRALTDFARIVDVFDASGVSFVSVTQAFNTTSSMGRLTLNVLLSFAQFEREVTGERIRDKIAASKRKGLWMGGLIPFGYEAAGRTLTPNADEARTVQLIYERYLALRSVDAVASELSQRNCRTKVRPDRHGRLRGGAVFSRGHLYRILANPLYAGQICHKGETYPGQHPALVDEATWSAAQALLRANGHARRLGTRATNPSPLAGLLTDAHGRKLSATHASKGGQRYRYYVSAAQPRAKPDIDVSGPPSSRWRLPAAEIEGVVEGLLQTILADERWLVEQVGSEPMGLGERDALLARAGELRAALQSHEASTKREALLALVQDIQLKPGHIAIGIRAAAFGTVQPNLDAVITLERAMSLRQRGAETRIIADGVTRNPEPDPALTKALAQAHRWWGDLKALRYATLRELAAAYGTDERYAARIVSLAFLPAPLTRAILDGTQEPEMTLQSFIDAPPRSRTLDEGAR